MIERVLQWLGFGLCHQLPERSFFGGGVQLPVCARDTGIYFGFVVAVIVIALVHRSKRPREFPSTAGWVVIALFVGAMGFDGVSSYAGFRQTTNDLRLITGIMAGYAAAAVIVPLLHDELWLRADSIRVLAPSWRLLLWVATVPVLFALLRVGGPALDVVYPLLTAGAILATFTIVNLAIVGMLPNFDRRAERLWDTRWAIAAAFVLTLLEMQAASMLRVLLFSLVG